MRNHGIEKDEAKSLKQKTRDRAQPKMGKIDIDYQKLHDAFFKYQRKPKLSPFGAVYYEGKEFETSIQRKRPGDLSFELVSALSIPPLAPPPWLINMQRFGPPPGYPGLKVPGLNSPIPPGAQWGFHPGGWGKPPTDEYGRPLYGDVFGVLEEVGEFMNVDKATVWGEIESSDEESDVPDEDSEPEAEPDQPIETVGTPDESYTNDRPSIPSSSATSTSHPAVPAAIEVRKRHVLRGDETDDRAHQRLLAKRAQQDTTDTDTDTHMASREEDKKLYTVLGEKSIRIQGSMGGDKIYDIGMWLFLFAFFFFF